MLNQVSSHGRCTNPAVCWFLVEHHMCKALRWKRNNAMRQHMTTTLYSMFQARFPLLPYLRGDPSIRWYFFLLIHVYVCICDMPSYCPCFPQLILFEDCLELRLLLQLLPEPRHRKKVLHGCEVNRQQYRAKWSLGLSIADMNYTFESCCMDCTLKHSLYNRNRGVHQLILPKSRSRFVDR